MPTPRENQGHATAVLPEDVDYAESARRALKTILSVRGITYAQLAEKLSALGYAETEASIAQKVRRGSFQLAFFLQCMRAIGVSQVTLTVPTSQTPDAAHA
jgi:hypothetical protein